MLVYIMRTKPITNMTGLKGINDVVTHADPMKPNPKDINRK